MIKLMNRTFFYNIPKDNNKCITKDCQKRATYGFLDLPRHIYKEKLDNTKIMCNNHKLKDMTNIYNNFCRVCYNNPSNMIPSLSYFNYREHPNGLLCGFHKEPDMIDVVNNLCHIPNCDIRVNHDESYCFKHRIKEPL